MRASFSLHNSQQRKRRSAQRVVAVAVPPPLPKAMPKDETMSSTRVLRSLSVPCNLPVMAENFMQAVVEETMREETKEQEPSQQQQPVVLRSPAKRSSLDDSNTSSSSIRKGFLPELIADSMRSEDDYFLPFDDDQTIPEDEALIIPTQTSAACEDVPLPPPPLPEEEQQKQPLSGRDVAVAALGEFFMCESPATQSFPLHASPVSTLDLDKTLSLEQQKSATALAAESSVSSDFDGNDSLTSVLEEESEDSVVATTHTETDEATVSPRRFIKLSHANRTTSLPLDFTPPSYASSATPPRLTRRSSLKKISSYGKFPSSRSSSNSLKRNVSFGSMKIREYNVALSDHPSCSYGPPIQLSWEYQEKEEIPLDSYERTRQGNRRQGHSLLLSFYERHFMLIKQAGYSKREIRETMKEVERVKRERQVTDLFLVASPIDETMEHVVDKVKQFFRRPQDDDKTIDLGLLGKAAVV